MPYENLNDITESVGQGWAVLLTKLMDNIIPLGFEYRNILQVKEKFGGLRFYYSYPENISDEYAKLIEEHIENAEKESDVTCEICGEPGLTIPSMSWLRTLCDTHYKEIENNAQFQNTQQKVCNQEGSQSIEQV